MLVDKIKDPVRVGKNESDGWAAHEYSDDQKALKLAIGQSGGFAPKVTLMHESKGYELSHEASSVIDTYLGEKLNKVTISSVGGAGCHFTDTEVRYIVTALALRIPEENIYANLKSERDKQGKDTPHFRNLSYYRKKYAELIDEIWLTTAMRIGEMYNYTDKVFRLARYNELADAIRDHVLDDVYSDTIDKLTIQKANLYINVLRNINAEMGGVTMEKVTSMKPRQDKESTTILDGVDIEQTLKDLVTKRFQDQLPEFKKVENGIGTPITEST